MEEGLRVNLYGCLAQTKSSVVCYLCRLPIGVVNYFKFRSGGKKKNAKYFSTQWSILRLLHIFYKALVLQRPIMATFITTWPQCPQNVCFFLWKEGRRDGGEREEGAWRLIRCRDLFAEARRTGGKRHVHLRFLTPNRKLFISCSLERSANWIKQSQRYPLPRLSGPWTAPDITQWPLIGQCHSRRAIKEARNKAQQRLVGFPLRTLRSALRSAGSSLQEALQLLRRKQSAS